MGMSYPQGNKVQDNQMGKTSTIQNADPKYCHVWGVSMNMSVPNMTLVDCMASKSFYLHEISLKYMKEKNYMYIIIHRRLVALQLSPKLHTFVILHLDAYFSIDFHAPLKYLYLFTHQNYQAYPANDYNKKCHKSLQHLITIVREIFSI